MNTMTSDIQSSGFMPVTIVIPVYNREVIIERCLASVEAQDIRPLKVILVDNNSTDGTLSKLTRWAEMVKPSNIEATVITESKQGGAAARNAGLAHVVTPWVMFFDSDDTMRTNHISKIVETIRRNPGTNLIGWGIKLHFLNNTTKTKHFPVKNILRNILFGGSLSTQSYAVTADLARKAGGWNSDLHCWDDIEFAVRLMRFSPVIEIIKGLWVDVYQSEDSITGMDMTSRADECIAALNHIEGFYPESMRNDVYLKRVILAGRMTFEKSPRGDGLFLQTIKHVYNRHQRLILRLAYAYTSRGYHGIARIMHPFI